MGSGGVFEVLSRAIILKKLRYLVVGDWRQGCIITPHLVIGEGKFIKILTTSIVAAVVMAGASAQAATYDFKAVANAGGGIGESA